MQTLTRVGVFPTRARTFWMFGFQRRFVRRWECDTDMPHGSVVGVPSGSSVMKQPTRPMARASGIAAA